MVLLVTFIVEWRLPCAKLYDLRRFSNRWPLGVKHKLLQESLTTHQLTGASVLDSHLQNPPDILDLNHTDGYSEQPPSSSQYLSNIYQCLSLCKLIKYLSISFNILNPTILKICSPKVQAAHLARIHRSNTRYTGSRDGAHLAEWDVGGLTFTT